MSEKKRRCFAQIVEVLIEILSELSTLLEHWLGFYETSFAHVVLLGHPKKR